MISASADINRNAVSDAMLRAFNYASQKGAKT